MARIFGLAVIAAVCVAAAVTPVAAKRAWVGATPDQWRSRTIYQIVTDRFANPSNTPCDNLSDYCGGTFQGVIDQLDYILDMGFDAIWISPVVKNTPGGYHGYWAEDLYQINPHFGAASDLSNLVAAAHAKGIWVMADVVANHMGNDPNGVSGFNPFNSQAHYHDCNNCPSNCQIQDWTDQPQVEHCKLAGLPDLNQTDPWVAQTLCSWVENLVQTYQFDGLRVDTVPEVAMDFWPLFYKAAGVYAVGEVFNGDVNYVAPYQKGALPGLLSYPLFFTLRNCFQQGQSLYNLQNMLQSYASAFVDVGLLGTFSDNQDNPRFLNGNGDYTLYKNVLTYVLMGEGIPIIYYGSEQGFNGGNDPNCRETLWPTGYSTSNTLYQHIKAVVGLRKQQQVWSNAQVQRYADDQFYAFTRGTTFVALTNVGSNGSPVSRTITYHPYSDGTQLCNALASNDCVTVSNSQFQVTLTQGMPKIYIPK